MGERNTQPEMTKPGLGSGALRPFETFTVIALHSDVDTTQQFVVTVVSERGSFSSAKRAFIEQAIRAALSLSSPIEPDCEFVNGRCRYCRSSKEEVDATTGKCVVMERPTSQASSEIREALEKLMAQWRGEGFDSSLYADQLQRALAPSRQGAGGK